jgi:germination protein M
VNGSRLRAYALFAAAAMLMAIAAACGGGGTSSPSPSATITPSTSPTITPTPTPTMQLSVYFLRDGKVAAAHRRVPQTQRVAVAALRQLLAGPTAVEQAAGLSSAVPGDLSILGVSISGGTAVVDVGGGLVAGGVQRTLQRLAQLTYTATQFSMVDVNLCQPKQTTSCVLVGNQLVSRVRFLQNGDPLAVEGSGIDFTKPVSRASFEEFTPAIFVESPTVDETVKSPLLVWGTANTFEAVFWLQVQTPGGTKLLRQRVMATSGSGTRGTFRVRLSFTPQGGAGRLVAYEISMADGSRINVVVIPLTFAQ